MQCSCIRSCVPLGECGRLLGQEIKTLLKHNLKLLWKLWQHLCIGSSTLLLPIGHIPWLTYVPDAVCPPCTVNSTPVLDHVQPSSAIWLTTMLTALATFFQSRFFLSPPTTLDQRGPGCHSMHKPRPHTNCELSGFLIVPQVLLLTLPMAFPDPHDADEKSR